MVVGEKIVFYEAYEEVCNTVDLFVIVVTKRKTVSVGTNSARRSKVSELGFLIGR